MTSLSELSVKDNQMANPCQDQLDTVRALEDAVPACQNRIEILQERLAHASESAKPAILNMINDANEDLRRARDALESEGPAARAEYEQCIEDALAAQALLPISVRVDGLWCDRETNEWSASDEPYVLVFVANIALAALDVECYRFGPWAIDAGEKRTINGWVWGTAESGQPMTADSLETFFVALTVLEHDELGSPKGMRVTVKAVGTGALAGSMSLPREDRITRLTRDIADTLDGLPFEDRLGSPVVWDITERDVREASLFGSSQRSFSFRGDGGRYRVVLTLLSHP